MRSVATQFFVNGALFASVVPRLPEVRDHIGVSTTTLGLVMSMAGLFGLVGSLTVGRAIERITSRRVILLGGTLVSISLGLIGVADSLAVVAIGLIGMLTFDVFVDVGMNLQGSWLSGRRATPVMNRLHGLWSLGTLAGGLVASRLAAANVSLTTHLLGAAGVLLLALVYVGRGLLVVDEGEGSSAADDEAASSGRTTGLTGVLVLFVLAGVFAVTLEMTSIDWAAFRLTDDFGEAPGVAVLGYVAVTVGMTVGRFAGDWVSARLRSVTLTRISLLALGVGMTVAAFAPSVAATLVGFVVAGLGSATLLPLLYDRAAQLPGRRGAGLGALTGGIRVAVLGVPVLMGVLVDSRLSVGQSIALLSLPSVAGFGIVASLLRRSDPMEPGDAEPADAAPVHLAPSAIAESPPQADSQPSEP